MTATLTARLRRLWLDVHLWLGAGLLVLTLPLGLSGSVLVVREPLERLLHAERYATGPAGPMLQPSAYLASAARAFGPAVKPSQLRLPARPGDPVVVSGRGRPSKPGERPAMLNAWIDPASGRVLATAPPMQGLVRLSHDLHGHMLIPGWGRTLVGWLGWAMFASCLTGLWLWWPRAGGPVRGLRWRRSPSTSTNLHHLAGFWILVPLAVLALTGVYICFPQTGRMLTGQGPAPKAEGPGPRGGSPLPRPALSPDAAAADAVASRPGATLASLSLPSRGPRPVWRVELRAPGAARPVAVEVEDATGQVRPARPQGGGDPVMRWVRGVHGGEAWGPVWAAVVFVAGFAPAVLGTTGVVMWLRREARKRALRRS